LNAIIEKFKENLKTNNQLPSGDIQPLDLWTIAIKQYLKYPKN
jgi:hypothetical protein